MAVVNRAAINMGIQVSLLYIDLHSFGYMPKSGIVGGGDGHKVGLFLVN
jgi:hypothetical protein